MPLLISGFPINGAAAQVAPQQLTVTAANAAGDSIYDLTLATGGNGALITGTQPLNTDSGKHGSFDALAWLPNASTGTLDLIVADAGKGQILRYAGPNYGTSSVIFSYAGKGSGPASPAGLAVDGAGNLLVISRSSPLNVTPALWVLPFNKTTGVWNAPFMIDDSFSGVRTLALAEVLVAGTAATPDGNAAPAWNVGDVLVLVGDTFDSRVIVYSKAAIASVLANPKVSLSGPTSTVVTSREFLGLIAAPFGMDIWPADAVHGVSLLFTTIDGRIIRFDTSKNAFTSNFASGLGLGLEKLKVGTYAGKPYAFVAQLGRGPSGQILQFGAPPTSGNNKAVASVNKGVDDPIGLALTSSGSTPASSCVAPSSCSPVGPQLTVQISGPGASRIPAGATILQQACTVPTDPRVAVVNGVWSCLGPTINICGANPTPGCVPATLDVANYCPGFPSTILPATMCGHAGANGSSFQVIKGTAELLDENANDIYIQTTADPTVALPGPYDLLCAQGAGQYGPLLAFAPRSDLPTIEGKIVEDATLPFFADVTGYCDSGGGNTHVESMFAFGLGLNVGANGLGTGPTAGLYGFVTNKFNNLTTTIQEASAQITPQTVTTTLENYVTQSQNYFNSDYNNDVNDYSCALNSIASADIYLRQQAMGTAFSYTAPAAGNNNPNPAGEIDSRLANLYLSISGDFTYAPNPTWPTNNVPPCVTLTVSSPLAVGGSGTLTFGPPTLLSSSTPLIDTPTQCSLSATDGTYVHAATVPYTGMSTTLSTGTLTKAANYVATLQCGGVQGDSASSFATASVPVTSQPTLTSISVSPAAAYVPAGKTQQYTATGTYSSGPTQPLSSATWSTGNTGIATISMTGLATCVQQGTTSVTAKSGTVTSSPSSLVCSAPVLTSVAVTPANPSIAVNATQQFTATGTNSLGQQSTLSGVTWAAGNANVASISSSGLASCLSAGTSPISATSGSGNSAITGGTTLTCNAPTLVSIIVTPANPTLTSVTTQQFTATANFSYGPSAPLNPAQWNSSNTAIATVSSTGLATCLNAGGSTTISATAPGTQFSGSTTLTCPTVGALTTLSIVPATASVPVGSNQQYYAYGYDAYGNQLATVTVTWASSNVQIASINTSGLATCSNAGPAIITAKSGNIVSNQATLTCSGPTLASITVSPANASAIVGATVQFSVTATDTQGNPTSPGPISWSSNSAAATVDNTGLATCVQSGAASITANTTTGTPATSSGIVTCTLTTTYQYTGNQFPYYDAYSPYNSNERVIASMTVSVPLPLNGTTDATTLPGFTLTMSDGVQTLPTAAGATPYAHFTTTNGQITSWSVGLNSTSNAAAPFGISTQLDPTNGTVDLGYVGSGTLCDSPTPCASIANNAGTWTSSNVQNLHVIVGTTSGSNPQTGQLYQFITGGADSQPTLQPISPTTTILNQAPEPTTCFSGNSSVASGAASAVSSLGYLGSGDLVAANYNTADVFRLSGPSFQPTADIFNASAACSNGGPTNIVAAVSTVAASGTMNGSMVGVGVMTTPAGSQLQGIFEFLPNPTGANDYVFLDNVNSDNTLKSTTCNGAGFGCVNSLVDAVASNYSVSGTSVVNGDLLVLVGDALQGNTNPVVLDFSSQNISKGGAQGQCQTGGSTPCSATQGQGGTQLVLQNALLLHTGESPISMDLSATGMYIATSAGNIYKLTATGNIYANPQNYATGLSGIQKVRVGVDPVSLSERVFVTVQGNINGLYEFAGTPPTGGFTTSGAGVAYTAVSGTPAGLAVH